MRGYAQPLKDAGVDTVILGCTHYPLIRPILQRVFGRDVTLVFSAEETAREVAETLARKGIENAAARDGAYRFLTTGDPKTFRAMGARFLQLPIDEVEHVDAARARGRRMREGRRPDELRPLEIEIDYLEQPHGAVLWSQGKTIVLCTASIEEGVPRWLRNSGRGWMTAEYSLLAGVDRRAHRARGERGKQGGRTIEIQRLIGRAIRAVTDFDALGERTDLPRLRRPAGRRRHALRGDLRRLRRRQARARPLRPLEGARRLGRGGLGRHRRRRAAARPRVHRGLDARRST